MTMQEAVDSLRGRCLRLWRCATPEMQATLPLHRNTMQRFFRGEQLSQRVLSQIERWCDTQEERTHD